MSRCVVISAGPFRDPLLLAQCLEPDDYIIAADGGWQLALLMGASPAVLVADFDSMTIPALPDGVKVITLPVKKDVTDTEAAMNYGFEQGCREFLLLGCTGGRLDHQQAALTTASNYAQKGCSVMLVDEQNEIHLLTPGSYLFPAIIGEKVSLFAFGGEVKGLFATGLVYEVSDLALSPFNSLCVSNESIEEDVCLWFKEGLLMLYFSRD